MLQGDPRPFETFATLKIYWIESVVELVRTREAYASAAELRSYWSDCYERVRTVPPGKFSIVTDLRQPPGRNDEEFERLMGELRRPFYERFKRQAIVVKTWVGRIQVARHTDGDRLPTAIFHGMKEALTWFAECREAELADAEGAFGK